MNHKIKNLKEAEIEATKYKHIKVITHQITKKESKAVSKYPRQFKKEVLSSTLISSTELQ